MDKKKNRLFCDATHSFKIFFLKKIRVRAASANIALIASHRIAGALDDLRRAGYRGAEMRRVRCSKRVGRSHELPEAALCQKSHTCQKHVQSDLHALRYVKACPALAKNVESGLAREKKAAYRAIT